MLGCTRFGVRTRIRVKPPVLMRALTHCTLARAEELACAHKSPPPQQEPPLKDVRRRHWPFVGLEAKGSAAVKGKYFRCAQQPLQHPRGGQGPQCGLLAAPCLASRTSHSPRKLFWATRKTTPMHAASAPSTRLRDGCCGMLLARLPGCCCLLGKGLLPARAKGLQGLGKANATSNSSKLPCKSTTAFMQPPLASTSTCCSCARRSCRAPCARGPPPSGTARVVVRGGEWDYHNGRHSEEERGRSVLGGLRGACCAGKALAPSCRSALKWLLT